MRTLLLTGAIGLVGSRLLQRLAEDGFKRRALVCGDVELPPEDHRRPRWLGRPRDAAFGDGGFDVVVHLAGVFRTEDEDAIRSTNLGGTRILVAAVPEHTRGARLVMSSTRETSTTQTQRGRSADPTRPSLETEACSPTAMYGASKVAAEQLLRGSGLTQAAPRLPFVHGEGAGHLASLQRARSHRGGGAH